MLILGCYNNSILSLVIAVTLSLLMYNLNVAMGIRTEKATLYTGLGITYGFVLVIISGTQWQSWSRRGCRYDGLGRAWGSSPAFSHFPFSVLLQPFVMTEIEQALLICGSTTYLLCSQDLGRNISPLFPGKLPLWGHQWCQQHLPSTGMCSSGDGVGWARRQDQILAPHWLPVTLYESPLLITCFSHENRNVSLTSLARFCNGKEKACSSIQ